MRIERLSLRAWILLGAALLSAAAWLATVLGAGGQVSGQDSSDVPVPPLPQLPAIVVDPLASPSSFSAISERPVFAEDRRPHPFRLGGGPQNAAGGTLRLTGVLLSGDFGMATLSGDPGRSVRLRLHGEAVEGWQLLALEPRRATVLGPDGAQVLELAVFDGQGGEPPTALRDPRTGTGNARPAVAGPPPQASPAARGAQPAARGTPAPAAAPGGGPSAADAAANQGPSEEQMRAIRERIRARREQLQQQQQNQSTPPPGGAANP